MRLFVEIGLMLKTGDAYLILELSWNDILLTYNCLIKKSTTSIVRPKILLRSFLRRIAEKLILHGSSVVRVVIYCTIFSRVLFISYKLHLK